MLRLVILAFCAFGFGTAFSCSAAVKSYNDLSATQIMALQESESRLLKDDQTLQALENDRLNKRISRQEFAYQDRELVSYIDEESSLQNAILIKQSTFPEHSRAVLRTIGKYSIQIPLVILTAILRSGGSFSP
jgi:hypothetical protein